MFKSWLRKTLVTATLLGYLHQKCAGTDVGSIRVQYFNQTDCLIKRIQLSDLQLFWWNLLSSPVNAAEFYVDSVSFLSSLSSAYFTSSNSLFASSSSKFIFASQFRIHVVKIYQVLSSLENKRISWAWRKSFLNPRCQPTIFTRSSLSSSFLLRLFTRSRLNSSSTKISSSSSQPWF